MNNILKINFGRRRRLTGLLGLSLDGGRLEGVVLHRSNGSVRVRQSFSAALTLDPQTAAPELVGREIRNHLEAAGVRERYCLVEAPLKWILAAAVELPPLAEPDAASLLQLEAERSFPCDVSTLQLENSRSALADGKKHVLLAGIAKSQIEPLLKVLAAAKLKPIGFAPGITALQPPEEEKKDGVVALAIGENTVGLQVTANGGVAALRSFEGAVAGEGARRALQAGLISREVRITLGQLPAELRGKVRRIRIFGPRPLARQLADELDRAFGPAGLAVETVERYSPQEFGVEFPPDAPVSAAFSLATRRLAGLPILFQFLPPKPTVLEQFVAKYSSGKLRSIGAAAAAVVAVVLGLFLFQQAELIHLRSQWSRMSAKVNDLTALQKKIQRYQGWYDSSFPALTVLRQLTLAFPEDGSVTAKSIEIRGGNRITCTGTASDNAALLHVLGQLRAADGVTDVNVEQIRGRAPMQFTFDLQWGIGNGGQP
ncbi:MAG TPA: hypothetical protein VFV81_07360 [Verrucomicrobiae bacterium]|nr:hypothetical protein [Verrucomicrobiae bacterium]